MPSTDLIQLPPMTREEVERIAFGLVATDAPAEAVRVKARNALHGEAGEGADLAAAAQNAVAAIDSMFDFFLRSGLVEEGGGLALYEEGKTLADARVKLAEALGGEAS